MPKQYHNLSLAKSPTEWRQLNADVTELVDELCEHGDYDAAQQLFTLIDLLTNQDYEANHREMLSHTALHRAFSMTKAFEAAVEAESRKQNPVALRKAS